MPRSSDPPYNKKKQVKRERKREKSREVMRKNANK
jgi:hypothetical protein